MATANMPWTRAYHRQTQGASSVSVVRRKNASFTGWSMISSAPSPVQSSRLAWWSSPMLSSHCCHCAGFSASCCSRDAGRAPRYKASSPHKVMQAPWWYTLSQEMRRAVSKLACRELRVFCFAVVHRLNTAAQLGMSIAWVAARTMERGWPSNCRSSWANSSPSRVNSPPFFS